MTTNFPPAGLKVGGERNFMSDFIGTEITFQDEPGIGFVTDETCDSIFITHPFFTGWMFKAEYFDLLGVED